MHFCSYSEIYFNCKNPGFIMDKREEMVKLSNEIGINKTAKFYKTSRNTIKRWRRRYLSGGRDNLADLSKRPKNMPKTAPKEVIDKINKLVTDKKVKKHRVTSAKVYRTLKLEKQVSYVTCNKYVSKALGKKKKRKITKTNGGDTSWKNNLSPFEKIQVDVKYLTDIESLKPYFKDNCLPKYEFTFRDVSSGLAIVAYGSEKSVTNTHIFFKNVIDPFLKSIPGLDLKKVSFQTDNGSENTNRKRKGPVYTDLKKSIVTQFIEEHYKDHKTIIPGHCTAQSDVESFHNVIERECLAWDEIVDQESLLYYTDAFLSWFNNKIRFKKDYTPVGKIERYFNCKVTIPKAVILDNFL